MRLIVIGASSFIGSCILAEAENMGIKVVGTQYKSKSEGLLNYNILTDKISDIIPSSFLTGSDNVNAVICSAVTKIDSCFLNMELSKKLNVIKTVELINEFAEMGIKPIFISSEAAYDGYRGYYSEDVPPTPINEYGRQKVEVETYIRNNLSHYLIFRLSMIVGDNCLFDHLLLRWYKCIQIGAPIECIRGQVFSPTYLKDVAHGILYALKNKMNGLYHLANPEFFSRDELARQFIISIGSKTEILVKELQEFNFYEKRSMKTYLDGTKFRSETNMCFTSMREVFDKFKQNVLK